jgi:DNA invertase Pin-like site-specific DNA recombinase
MKRKKRSQTHGKIVTLIRLNKHESELPLAERRKLLKKQRAEIIDYLGVGSHMHMKKKHYVELHHSNPYKMPEFEKAIRHAIRNKADIVLNRIGTRMKNLKFIDLVYDASENHSVKFYVCYQSVRAIDASVLVAISNEHRAEVSRNTKYALAKLKRKGVKLGSKDIDKLTEHAVKSHTDKRLEFAVKMRPVVEEIQQYGATTLSEIAKALNMREIETRYNPEKSSWHASTVSNLLKSIEEIKENKKLS